MFNVDHPGLIAACCTVQSPCQPFFWFFLCYRFITPRAAPSPGDTDRGSEIAAECDHYHTAIHTIRPYKTVICSQCTFCDYIR